MRRSGGSLPTSTNRSNLRVTAFGGLRRSALMSRIRSRGNASTELRMMHLLRHASLRGWRRHYLITGCPDFCWPRKHVALFVHGCFWHGHSCGRNLEPKSNRAFWWEKLQKNKHRDDRTARILRQRGWTVVTIWECDLRRNPSKCIRRLANVLSRGSRKHKKRPK